MTPTDVKLTRALQSRLRVVAQRSRQTAKKHEAGSYEHAYRIGLAVGYEEAAKRITRLLRTAKGRP